MGTNTAYYAAEDALCAKIATLSEAELRRKMTRFVRIADPSVNRLLFATFSVTEAGYVEPDAPLGALEQIGSMGHLNAKQEG